MNNIDEKYYNDFTKPIIKIGMLTNLSAALFSFIPSIILWLIYGALPNITDILRGFLLVASVNAVYYVIEPISYFPIVGLPGIYMVCLSGNIGNMRIPCAAIAQEAVGVRPGSKKGELVSTVGIAGSIITNLIIVTIAAFAGASIMSVVPAFIKEAFQYVSPAIFGSMFAMFAVKDYFLGSWALGITLFMLLFLGFLPAYIMIPIAVFSSIALAVKKEQNVKAESY